MNSKWIGATTLLLIASSPAAALEDEDLYYRARASLVQLVGAGAEGGYYFGSGVTLPDGNVVTSCHVTQHAIRIEPFWGRSGLKADSQQADVTHDLCLLHIPGLKTRPAEIASSRHLRLGDKVYAFGFNGGRSLTYQAGEVAELFDYDDGKVIRTTAAFAQGASGGALFDAQGRLVGILTFYRVGGETAYFAVPVEWIKNVEQFHSDGIKPIDGVPFWAASLERQPAFLRAGALEADGRWEELIAFAQTWVESDPRDSHAWHALARAAIKIGDHVTAETALKRAVESGSSSNPAATYVAPASED
jgi:serine protease Do